MHNPPNILVIYTGGTIGMMKDAQTGVLAPFDFTQLLKHIPELNQLGAQISSISFGKPIDSSNMNLEQRLQRPQRGGRSAAVLRPGNLNVRL